MSTDLFQILMVFFFGGIATYDTLKRNRKDKKDEHKDQGEIFKLQN